jgi:hypothetical protein
MERPPTHLIAVDESKYVREVELRERLDLKPMFTIESDYQTSADIVADRRRWAKFLDLPRIHEAAPDDPMPAQGELGWKGNPLVTRNYPEVAAWREREKQRMWIPADEAKKFEQWVFEDRVKEIVDARLNTMWVRQIEERTFERVKNIVPDPRPPSLILVIFSIVLGITAIVSAFGLITW